MSLSIHVAAGGPLLDLGAFAIRCAQPVDKLATPPVIAGLGELGAVAPLATSDEVQRAVRDLLRAGGFKPSGRGKPASEYLAAAFEKAAFPRINPLVDACNVVSLHSGLPISLVDIDRLDGAELAVRIAPAGTKYPFNPSGQTIDVSGLVCVYDAQGPTGTPVKDAQRTKTTAATTNALAIVWGTRALAGRTEATTRWYRELVAQISGAMIAGVALVD